MKIEAMQYFLRVAETRSIAKVAKKDGIPQQTLSSMMKSLENECGAVFFLRENKTLSLTKEGQLFYGYCEQFCKSYREMRIQLFEERQARKMNLCISSQNNITQTLIPHWMSAILRVNPEINIDVKIANALEVVQDVSNGTADVGFILMFEKGATSWPEVQNNLVFHPLFYNKPYLWVNEENPIAQFKTYSMKMMGDTRVIQDPSSDINLVKYINEEYFGVSPEFITAVNPHIMAELVKNNIAVCPDLRVVDGRPTLSSVFEGIEGITLLPLSPKDDYKLVTGYIVKEVDLDSEMKELLKLL